MRQRSWKVFFPHWIAHIVYQVKRFKLSITDMYSGTFPIKISSKHIACPCIPCMEPNLQLLAYNACSQMHSIKLFLSLSFEKLINNTMHKTLP